MIGETEPVVLVDVEDSEPGGVAMAWDFETDPEYQQKLDWAGG